MNQDFYQSDFAKDLSPDESLKPLTPIAPDQYFWGHGKILLAGEYLVLEGGKGLGLPTKWGQSLSVTYRPSFNPTLSWKSYDHQKNLWLDVRFEFWRFNILDQNPSPHALVLQKILRQARKQNPHFLRDEVDVIAESELTFPLDWGLGSSSTLIHNIADWAFTGPFELLFKTLGGSGLDVAAAQADGPILYEKKGPIPQWSHVKFSPPFSQELYFVHLGKKQDTAKSVDQFKNKQISKETMGLAISEVNNIVEQMVLAQTSFEFMKLMVNHEMILSEILGIPSVSKERFSDFEGATKSLGAWGGDFILACSSRPETEVLAYFAQKGHQVVIPYDQMVLDFSHSSLFSNIHFEKQAGHGIKH